MGIGKGTERSSEFEGLQEVGGSSHHPSSVVKAPQDSPACGPLHSWVT